VKSFALALGAGGARGLAHIAVFEALDEMGVKPAIVSGCSIGAAIGAAYCAGMSPRAIRRHVIELAHDRAELFRRLLGARAVALSSFLRAPFGKNPLLLDADKFCLRFLPEPVPDDFAKLQIPLLLIATDLCSQSEVLFSQGPLRPAIAASMAIPGIVRPVEMDGRVLVDGAVVDPLPFTQLAGRADVVVAIDCNGDHMTTTEVPDAWGALFASLSVMGQTIVAEKLKHRTPDLLIRPNVGIFRLLDFLQASAIIRAAEAVKDEVKERLTAVLK
jgi:NTE family protein